MQAAYAHRAESKPEQSMTHDAAVTQAMSFEEQPAYDTAGMPLYLQRSASGGGSAAQDGAGLPSLVTMLPIQAMLEVSSPGDWLEQQADSIADSMVSSAPSVQRSACGCGGSSTSGDECPACQAAKVLGLQRKADGAAGESLGEAGPSRVQAGPRVEAALSSGGLPLPASELSFFESRLGRDLSSVRIHDDGLAADASREVAARAFTHGRDIFFGSGHWSPGTAQGRRLLSHELVHVLQQTPAVKRKAIAPGAIAEPSSAARMIQRDACEDLQKDVQGAVPRIIKGANPYQPEITQAVAGQISDADFEAQTGVPASRLPADSFVSNQQVADWAGSAVSPSAPPGPSPTDIAATAAGPAALGVTTPISLTPSNAIGLLVTEPHLSIFSKVDGALTVRGFRANILAHIGRELPGPFGQWFTEQLITGKFSGQMRGDQLFALFGKQSVIYVEVDPATAKAFQTQISETTYKGQQYHASPPNPASPKPTEALTAQRLQARGTPQALLCTNNCITVPLREVTTVLGTRPTVGGVDLTTGNTASGEYNRYEKGRMAMMRDWAKNPDLSRGRPGLQSAQITPAAARAVGYIRVGGGVLTIYAVYKTGSRLYDAWGTDDFGLVVAQEGFTWAGAIAGASMAGAAAGAIVCSPGGPVSLLCALGGFVAGLIGGAIGGTIGAWVIPLIVRIIFGTIEAMLMLLEAASAIGDIVRGVSGAFVESIFEGLFTVRNSLNPCNWEYVGLAQQTRQDLNVLGWYLWSRIEPLNADGFLGEINKPLSSYGIPAALIGAIAEGLSAADPEQTGVAATFTAEHLAGLPPKDFVKQMRDAGILRFKYDPAWLARVQLLPDEAAAAPAGSGQ